MKNKMLKILYIEDSKADVELVKHVLKKSDLEFDLQQAGNRESFEELLRDFKPDIILSDHSLFQFDSLEAFKIVKERNMNIPFILVSGTISEEFAVKTLRTGASDYILKNNLSRLPIAIANTLKEKEIEREKQNYQKQLEEKNKDLNTLIYKITHDLRGPVCSILGLTEIARKDLEENEYIVKIAESALKLDTILISLMDTMYNREASVSNDKINFKSIINEIRSKFQFIEPYKDVKIEFSSKGKKPFYSDLKIITSILQNIIENSCKYKDHSMKTPVVRIEITITDENALLTISDNGIGIPSEIQNKVFDMFYRGNLDSRGSGLGLYLVKTGIEKLKGKISMESVLKKGTKFDILLPNFKH